MTEATLAGTVDLVPEGNYSGNESGASLELASGSRTYLLELEILRVIDQQSLDVSIWGSADGEDWGKQPVLKLPQRFYPGATRAVLDLTQREEIKVIQPRWEMNRWGRGRPVPVFRFRLTARPVG